MRFIRILSFLLLLSCLLSSCLSTQPTTDDSTSTPQTNESTTEAITTEPIETVWLDALSAADYLTLSAEELVALIPSDTAIKEALVPLSESLIAHYEQNGLFHLSAPPDEMPYQADALAINSNIIPHLLAYGHRSEVLSADMKANEDAYIAQGYQPGAWQKELHRARVLRDLACALMGVTLSERTDFLNDLTDKGIDVLITEDGAVATNHSVRILRLYCYTLNTGS